MWYSLLIKNKYNSRTKKNLTRRAADLAGCLACLISLACILYPVSHLFSHQSYSLYSPIIDWCTCLTYKLSWTNLSLTYIISYCIYVSNLSNVSIIFSHLPVKLSNLFASTSNYSIIRYSRGLFEEFWTERR